MPGRTYNSSMTTSDMISTNEAYPQFTDNAGWLTATAFGLYETCATYPEPNHSLYKEVEENPIESGKVKPVWIQMMQEMTGALGCSDIRWTICKQSAPHSRQITTPTPYQSIFTGQMLFLTPNQQYQSTEGQKVTKLMTNKAECIRIDEKSQISWNFTEMCIFHGTWPERVMAMKSLTRLLLIHE